MVGGFAAQLHGARRPTNDLDVAPATDVDNLDRIAAALRELDARVRVDGRPALPFSCTAAGDLDVAFVLAGFANGYADLLPNAVSATVGAFTVKVAALPDIIRSKSAEARAKDIDALPELNRLARQGMNERGGTASGPRGTVAGDDRS